MYNTAHTCPESIWMHLYVVGNSSAPVMFYYNSLNMFYTRFLLSTWKQNGLRSEWANTLYSHWNNSTPQGTTILFVFHPVYACLFSILYWGFLFLSTIYTVEKPMEGSRTHRQVPMEKNASFVTRMEIIDSSHPYDAAVSCILYKIIIHSSGQEQTQ